MQAIMPYADTVGIGGIIVKTLLNTCLDEEVVIYRIVHVADVKRRLMDLGFMEEENVRVVLLSPSKGIRAYLVKGCKIALRNHESAGIMVYERGISDAD